MFKSISTITKILATATGAAGTATAVSIHHDMKSFDTIEDIQPIGDVVPEADTQDAADQIINSAEV